MAIQVFKDDEDREAKVRRKPTLIKFENLSGAPFPRSGLRRAVQLTLDTGGFVNRLRTMYPRNELTFVSCYLALKPAAKRLVDRFFATPPTGASRVGLVSSRFGWLKLHMQVGPSKSVCNAFRTPRPSGACRTS